jgi:hypothetical protein
MRHELKIWPQYFRPVADGDKTFEVRKNDRGFQKGDVVMLREWDPAEVTKNWTGQGRMPTEPRGYTGEHAEFMIGYVMPIDAERVVFSLLPVQESRKDLHASGL